MTFDPQILNGRACIRGMRMSVSQIVNLVAHGMTPGEIIHEYPEIESEDIQQSLEYAAALANEEVHLFAVASA
ncbi:MAG: DUF433 domain-containing protein [Bryobacteraceae bacterium]|nr:DUF433 domain-containing protein [Bryobacteraceae bacterium]